MQLILTQDVAHLGSLGDEVRVKDGYGRNFLLPRGMAIMAGSKNLAQIEHRRRQLEGLRQQAIENARSESAKVGELKIAVQAKAGANGRLFGSVTNRDIQAVLAEYGYALDRRAILLHTPIRNVGTFTATVKLHTDVKVEISIAVTPLPGAGGEMPEGETALPVEEGAAGEAAAAEVAAAPADAPEETPPAASAAGEPAEKPAAEVASAPDGAGHPGEKPTETDQ